MFLYISFSFECKKVRGSGPVPIHNPSCFSLVWISDLESLFIIFVANPNTIMKTCVRLFACLFMLSILESCTLKEKSNSQSVSKSSIKFESESESEKDHLYISNGIIKIGLDLSAGGSLFHFSEQKTGRNLINYYDKGRFIQQSYYGIEDGSNWNGQPWRWNPIQGGGYRGEATRISERKFKDNALYIKSVPKHWATGKDIIDAVMEQTVILKEETAHIHYEFTYSGNIQHPAVHQELPAVFVDAALPNLVYYEGKTPWKGDSLTSCIPGWPNESKVSNENWSAYTDAENWGIGVYTPGTSEITTYRFQGDGKEGPKGSACSYFAPVRTFAITPGIQFGYDVFITIGTVSQIRARFYKIHENEVRNSF